jgi:long-subunit acyl-CoA synthetase (AMP-forming)
VTRRLAGSDGKILEEDEVLGEIHIRSPNLMKGYLNNEKATSEAFTADGWIRSGDVGYVKEGRWYVVDRAKDLIKVRG